jgi:hypothetical protein
MANEQDNNAVEAISLLEECVLMAEQLGSLIVDDHDLL